MESENTTSGNETLGEIKDEERESLEGSSVPNIPNNENWLLLTDYIKAEQDIPESRSTKNIPNQSSLACITPPKKRKYEGAKEKETDNGDNMPTCPKRYKNSTESHGNDQTRIDEPGSANGIIKDQEANSARRDSVIKCKLCHSMITGRRKFVSHLILAHDISMSDNNPPNQEPPILEREIEGDYPLEHKNTEKRHVNDLTYNNGKKECDKVIQNPENGSKISKDNNALDKNKKQRGWIQCPAEGCPHKTNTYASLQKHLRFHKFKNTKKCSYCSFCTSTHGLLTIHLLEHIEEENEGNTLQPGKIDSKEGVICGTIESPLDSEPIISNQDTSVNSSVGSQSSQEGITASSITKVDFSKLNCVDKETDKQQKEASLVINSLQDIDTPTEPNQSNLSSITITITASSNQNENVCKETVVSEILKTLDDRILVTAPNRKKTYQNTKKKVNNNKVDSQVRATAKIVQDTEQKLVPIPVSNDKPVSMIDQEILSSDYTCRLFEDLTESSSLAEDNSIIKDNANDTSHDNFLLLTKSYKNDRVGGCNDYSRRNKKSPNKKIDHNATETSTVTNRQPRNEKEMCEDLSAITYQDSGDSALICDNIDDIFLEKQDDNIFYLFEDDDITAHFANNPSNISVVEDLDNQATVEIGDNNDHTLLDISNNLVLVEGNEQNIIANENSLAVGDILHFVPNEQNVNGENSQQALNNNYNVLVEKLNRGLVVNGTETVEDLHIKNGNDGLVKIIVLNDVRIHSTQEVLDILQGTNLTQSAVPTNAESQCDDANKIVANNLKESSVRPSTTDNVAENRENICELASNTVSKEAEPEAEENEDLRKRIRNAVCEAEKMIQLEYSCRECSVISRDPWCKTCDKPNRMYQTDPLKCPGCLRILRNGPSLDRHFTKNLACLDGPDVGQCPLCEFKSTLGDGRIQLSLHFQAHVEKKKNLFNCPFCDLKNTDVRTIIWHIKENHYNQYVAKKIPDDYSIIYKKIYSIIDKPPEPPTIEPPKSSPPPKHRERLKIPEDLKCEYCPTQLINELEFKAHVNKHFIKLGIQCPICTFNTNKTDVLKHLMCHVANADGIFKCPMCETNKRNKENLSDHIKVEHSKSIFAKHNATCKHKFCNGYC